MGELRLANNFIMFIVLLLLLFYFFPYTTALSCTKQLKTIQENNRIDRFYA